MAELIGELDAKIALRHWLHNAGGVPLFTGRPADTSGCRPFGCISYPKVYNPVTKAADRAIRCVYLGPSWDQPGGIHYHPPTRRVVVTPHANFVPSEHPGLTLGAHDYQQAHNLSLSFTKMAQLRAL